MSIILHTLMKAVESFLTSSTKITGEDFRQSKSVITDARKNRNIDVPYNNYRELNSHVKNYIMAEFVAVPPDFNCMSHLSMREHVGMFSAKDINITQLKIISDAVASSPVFTTLNNETLNPKSCFFFLQLLSELNLILTGIDNPLRRSHQEYKEFIKLWEKNRTFYVRGQDVDRISFLIVNVVPLLSQKIIDKAWASCLEVSQFQKEVNETNYKFD